MSSIIFLDIDGVLNTLNNLRKQQRNGEKVSGKRWCPVSCKSIVALCKHYRARIVVSSSWRLEYGMEELGELFEFNGIPRKYLLDRTPGSAPHPYGENYCRGHEIRHWLENYPQDVASYVIIDDEATVLEEQESHLVRVDRRIGFAKKEAVVKASEILNRN